MPARPSKQAGKPSQRESDAVDHILHLLACRRPDLDLRASEITARLFRLREVVINLIHGVHAQFGLKPRMFLVLGALYRAGPPYKLSPAALVRSLVWTSAGLSQLLDRMESAGLIRREDHPRDRRSLHVALTPKGEKIIAAAYDAHCRAELRVIASLTEPERRTLVNLLRRLLIATEGAAHAKH
jgi:DNA-binding MarR family transcriptional regulator